MSTRTGSDAGQDPPDGRAEDVARAVERSPIIIFSQDRDLRYTWIFNPAPGFEHEQVIGKTDDELLPSPTAAELTALKRRVLETGEQTQQRVSIPLSDGPHIYDLIVAPQTGDSGETIGISCVAVDVSERDPVVRQLRETEARFRHSVEVSPMPAVGVDEHCRIRLVNGRLEHLSGYSRAELIGQPVEVLVPQHLREQHVHHRDGYLHDPAARRMGEGLELVLQRRDGTHVPVEITLSPKFSVGEGARVLALVSDVSARKQAEEHARIVMAELSHRVKNVICVIEAIAMQMLRGSHDRETFCRRFQDRLKAIADAHDLLTRTDWQGALLQDIVSVELATYAASAERYSLSGPPVTVEPKAALALHMVVHELTTNACKYGALKTGAGRVEVEWAVEEPAGRDVRLTWRERGEGPVAEPRRTGYGSRLIQHLVQYELGGHVRREFRPEGVQCSITFPRKLLRT